MFCVVIVFYLCSLSRKWIGSVDLDHEKDVIVVLVTDVPVAGVRQAVGHEACREDVLLLLKHGTVLIAVVIAAVMIAMVIAATAVIAVTAAIATDIEVTAVAAETVSIVAMDLGIQLFLV